MMEFLKFTFDNPFTFIGVVILLGMVLDAIGGIITALTRKER